MRTQQAEAAAEERKERALRQELAHQAPAARTERDANRSLLPPRDRLREEQAGHVPAGDEEDETDRSQEQEQRRAHVAGELRDSGSIRAPQPRSKSG